MCLTLYDARHLVLADASQSHLKYFSVGNKNSNVNQFCVLFCITSVGGFTHLFRHTLDQCVMGFPKKEFGLYNYSA